MRRTLPLFPLGSLLFPGGMINLHIFEERYRLMIGRCLSEQIPFGVVLLRQGDEVAEGRLAPAAPEPYAIGTVAEISAHVRLDDGRYLVSAVGRERFRIERVVERAPYLLAEVAELPEPVPPGAAAAARELRALYDRYWQAMSAATGMPLEAEELRDEPLAMSYQLADRLQITAERKQRWLEAGLLDRLGGIAAALSAELALLPPGGAVAGEWGGLGSQN